MSWLNKLREQATSIQSIAKNMMVYEKENEDDETEVLDDGN